MASWHVDDRISGDTEPADRKALLEALDAIRTTGAGVFVVAKRDRIARDIVVAAVIERLVQKEGAKVRSADGSSDDDSPQGQLVRGMLDLIATHERAMIRQRTRSALAVKRARGEVLGSTPFGYQRAEDGKTLEANDAEQKVLLRVRELHGEKRSLREIATLLDREGARSRAGKPFSHVQVRQMLVQRDWRGRVMEKA